MDYRGGQFGGGPELAQLGGVGQQAQPQVPGLLQMAQAAMDGGGGFGGGPSFSANDIPFGAEVRPITSPQDQNWSDAQGRPIHVGGKPPAYNPGTTFGGYNAVFDERAPSSTGGWFTMEDYLNQAPTPMQAAGWGEQQSSGSQRGFGGGPSAPTSGGMQSPQRGPRAGQVNNNALSTNNWRLLGNDPDAFMINGTVVSRAAARRELAPKSVLGQEGGGFPGYWPYGGGVWATPVSSYGWNQGYIGGQGWGPSSTPTY